MQPSWRLCKGVLNAKRDVEEMQQSHGMEGVENATGAADVRAGGDGDATAEQPALLDRGSQSRSIHRQDRSVHPSLS